MNILLTTDVFPPNCGGSGWSTYSLARSLMKAGNEVDVLAYQSGFTGVGTDEYGGVKVTRVGRNIQTDAVSRLLEKKLSSGRFSSQIKDLLDRKKIDVIHAAHYLSAAATYNVIRKIHVPFIITVRDYWPVCLYSTMVYDNNKCTGCNDGKLRKCFLEYNKRYSPLRSIILPAIKREMKNRRDLLLNADRVVFVSRYVRKVIKKNIANLKGDVIHNGVDLRSIQASLNTPSNYSLKDSFALYIGKIEKHKGSEILKSLFKSKKVDLPLVVIGEGSEREELIKTAEENNRRSVFLNWIANNEVLKIMSGAQFLLFPSIWAEPLSRVLLEAVSVGLPVVAVNSGGTPEIIENNRNGFLVKNSEEFIRKANQLSNDNVILKRLSQQGKQIARDRFDQSKLTRKWIDLYEKVIKENKKSRD